MIYLDNAATTKVADEALDAMLPYLRDEYGNAGSLHRLGRSGAKAVQKAREQTASLFGCEPGHVIFTSGGSEGNSTVFHGLRDRLADSGRTHVVVSAVEHDSVLCAARQLEQDGFRVTYVQPDSDGCVPTRAVEGAIRRDTGLVSVMFVNNETGAVNEIGEIGRICRQNGALFHTDCVQAAGQYPLDIQRNDVDFATVSAHKIHGPKGVGALYARDMDFLPLICGGAEQECGLRGGTENVPGCVGLGVSAEIAVENMRADMLQVSSLKQRFYMMLLDALKGLGEDSGIVHVNGRPVVEPGKTLNLRFDGIDAQTLLLMLDTQGVCASSGSACRSRELEPSRVLTAMGLSSEEARASVRFSFSRYNTAEEAYWTAQIIAACVRTLRPRSQ